MWLTIGIIAVVAFIVLLFVLRKKGIIEKDVPRTDSFMGLDWRNTVGFSRPDGGMLYIKTERMFPDTEQGNAQRALVCETVINALAAEHATAKRYHPEWNVPETKDVAVMFLEPTYYTVDRHKPGLLLQSLAYSKGSNIPTSEPTPTIGTVLNAGASITPTSGGITNPWIVLAAQDAWDDMEWLYNGCYNESEHVTERWQSYAEYQGYSGTSDVHPHRPPSVGLVERTRTVLKFCCNVQIEHEPITLGKRS